MISVISFGVNPYDGLLEIVELDDGDILDYSKIVEQSKKVIPKNFFSNKN